MTDAETTARLKLVVWLLISVLLVCGVGFGWIGYELHSMFAE